MDKIQNTKDLSFYNNSILFTELLNKRVNDNITMKLFNFENKATIFYLNHVKLL